MSVLALAIVVMGSTMGWAQDAPEEAEAVSYEVSGPAVEVRKRVVPGYPSPLKALHGSAMIECTAVVDVDPRGAPAKVAVVDCPDGFHLAAASAFAEWRFDSPMQGGQRVTARTIVTTSFGAGVGRFTPGYSYLTDPSQVIADPEATVLLQSGDMPQYPRAVAGGHASCLVDAVATRRGSTVVLSVDGCATPYRKATMKVVRGWQWYPAVVDGQTIDVDVRFAVDFMK